VENINEVSKKAISVNFVFIIIVLIVIVLIVNLSQVSIFQAKDTFFFIKKEKSHKFAEFFFIILR